MKRLFTLLAAIVCTLSIYSQGVKFSWQGLSLVHPSNYKITDKEYDGETYDFCCEINDEDISMINFSILKNDLFAMLSQEDVIEASKESIDEALVEFRKTYTSMNFGEKKVNRNHRYAYVYRTFTGNLLGTHLYGKVIVMAHGDKYVVMILQAESQNYLNTLNEIVNTVRIEQWIKAPTGVESIQPSAVSHQKILRNGQVIILRGDKVYTLQGQKVK